jgi:hypothetical protein
MMSGPKWHFKTMGTIHASFVRWVRVPVVRRTLWVDSLTVNSLGLDSLRVDEGTIRAQVL